MVLIMLRSIHTASFMLISDGMRIGVRWMPFVRYNCQPILLAFERTRDLLISRFRLNNMECSQTMSEIQSTYSSRLNHHCSHEYVQVQPQPRQPNNDDALLQSLVSATIRTVLVKEKQKASIDLSNFN